MSEEEIIKQIKNDLNVGEFYGITEDAIQGLLDLYNKQKEKIISLENQLDFIGEQNKYINRLEYLIKKKDAYIEELENWTKEHPSVIEMPKEVREEAEKLGHFADLVTIEEKEYIGKDKVRDTLLKFQNEYGEDLETTDRLFIGKEVVQYSEDMLDEIAKELDIKLLEEE